MTALKYEGVYLAKLNASKGDEIAKVHPVVILTTQEILNISPAVVFACPLRSKSYPKLSALHIKIRAKENLEQNIFALVEHARSLSTTRLEGDVLAILRPDEVKKILD